MTTTTPTTVDVVTNVVPQSTPQVMPKTRIVWKNGLCSGTDSDIFFDPADAVKQLAHSICGVCPIGFQCLLYGMTEEFGIWGGMTEIQRKHSVTRKWVTCNRCGRKAVSLTHQQFTGEVCIRCGISWQLL